MPVTGRRNSAVSRLPFHFNLNLRLSASRLTNSIGCSKRSSSKAAASEKVRHTLRYVEPLSDAKTPLVAFFNRLLGFRHDVRISLFDTVDRMDLRDHDIGERPFILYADEDKDIRTSEAGVSLFHAGYAFQRADHVFGFSRFHFDENVGSRCHVSLLHKPCLMVNGGCSIQH